MVKREVAYIVEPKDIPGFWWGKLLMSKSVARETRDDLNSQKDTRRMFGQFVVRKTDLSTGEVVETKRGDIVASL